MIYQYSPMLDHRQDLTKHGLYQTCLSSISASDGETMLYKIDVLLNPVKPEAYLLALLVIGFSFYLTLTVLRVGLS